MSSSSAPSSGPRRWWRSLWPAAVLTALASIALVVGLVLLFTAPDTAGLGGGELASDLRATALILGIVAAILARYATITEPQRLAGLGRTLALRLFPGIDQQPPPATPAAARWGPALTLMAMLVWFGAGIWYLASVVGWLLSDVI